MAYLDVSPMMVALRDTPEEFELRNNWLFHAPSKHSFSFDSSNRVHIRADCNCAFLAVRPEQEKELVQAFHDWQTHYWRPLEINREFASHFQPRSWFRQMMIDLTGRLHRRLLRQPEHAHYHGQREVVPAE